MTTVPLGTKVSIITPTYKRSEYLRYLYGFYRAQTYSDLELLIADTSPEPDSFFTNLPDPTVKYHHFKEKQTIAWKRDFLIREATGEFIIHFDDDDYYSPSYVTCAAHALREVDLVKLTSWYGYDAGSGLFFYCDMGTLLPHHYRIHSQEGVSIVAMAGIPDTWIKQNLWGYGFSYAFRKSLYEKVQFDLSMNWGEDSEFLKRVEEAGFSVMGVPDRSGLSLHVIHSSNTSCVFPNYILPTFMVQKIFGPGAAGYIGWLSRGRKAAEEPVGPEACEVPV